MMQISSRAIKNIIDQVGIVMAKMPSSGQVSLVAQLPVPIMAWAMPLKKGVFSIRP